VMCEGGEFSPDALSLCRYEACEQLNE
jgi:hypothetical protein